MTMTPERRSWYLSTLGIVQYIPKGEESAALPFHSLSSGVSVETTEPEKGTDTTQSDSSNAAFSSSGHQVRVASMLELVGDNADRTPNLEFDTSDHSITVVDKSKPNTVELKCRIACWHPCDDMLVFNQLIPGEQPSYEQNVLLSNILKAIGRLPNDLPAPELLDWPLDHAVGENGNQSESGAKDMLSVFLDARIRKYGVLWVLLMGGQPSELFSAENKPYVDLLGRIEEIAGGARIIMVRGLQEMIEEPDLKAETWQTIRHLAEQP